MHLRLVLPLLLLTALVAVCGRGSETFVGNPVEVPGPDELLAVMESGKVPVDSAIASEEWPGIAAAFPRGAHLMGFRAHPVHEDAVIWTRYAYVISCDLENPCVADWYPVDEHLRKIAGRWIHADLPWRGKELKPLSYAGVAIGEEEVWVDGELALARGTEPVGDDPLRKGEPFYEARLRDGIRALMAGRPPGDGATPLELRVQEETSTWLLSRTLRACEFAGIEHAVLIHFDYDGEHRIPLRMRPTRSGGRFEGPWFELGSDYEWSVDGQPLGDWTHLRDSIAAGEENRLTMPPDLHLRNLMSWSRTLQETLSAGWTLAWRD